MTFRESLAKRRRFLGMTQKQLAVASGLGDTHISRIENGKTDPTLSSLQAIAFACHAEILLVPLDQLTEVRRIIGAPPRGANLGVGSAFLDVFIPDPDDFE